MRIILGMKTPLYITGNAKKAEYLNRYLGHPLEHRGLEIEEIQSLDVKTVVRHKMHSAYAQTKVPVLVEDTSLEFCALGRLPGTLIKWFLEELTHEDLCRLLDGKDRSAIARTVFGYYDGEEESYFAAMMRGAIAEKPCGENGFGTKGWDPIFIPEGYTKTRAEMSEDDYKTTYFMHKPIAQVQKFLME